MRLIRTLLTIATLSTSGSALHAATITGRVVAVADGDTLTLLDAHRRQHKIRLAGIDAPERAQPFGERAKLSLSALAFNRQAVADCGKPDRYRRSICTVRVNGKDVGLAQVSTGMAWWYRQYARNQSRTAAQNYEAAEFRARSQHLGLWGQRHPVPPWAWRRSPR